MLRIIINIDPSQKEKILMKSVEDKSDHRKNLLQEQYIQIDPMIKSVFDNSIPCRSVTNQNYRMYMDNVASEEQKKIQNVHVKIKNSKVKALKLKIAMERSLQDQEDQKKLLLIYQQQMDLKKQKRQIFQNKKVLRKRTMERQNIKAFLHDVFSSLLDGGIPQTPLVNKFLKMQMNSASASQIMQSQEQQQLNQLQQQQFSNNPQSQQNVLKNLTSVFAQDQEIDINKQQQMSLQIPALVQKTPLNQRQQQPQQQKFPANEFSPGFNINAYSKEVQLQQKQSLNQQQTKNRKSKRRENQKKKKKEKDAMNKQSKMEVEEQNKNK